MKTIGLISLFIVYIISIFGAVHLTNGVFKLHIERALIVFAVVAFALQLISKKRIVQVDILISAFALISSVGFFFFVIDSVFPPIAVADDCEGHKPSRIHDFDIISGGLLFTLISVVMFIRTHKVKLKADYFLSVFFIATVAISYAEFGFIKKIKSKIEKVSDPKIILPIGC